MSNVTLNEALLLSRLIENYCPLYGYHVGLTGGCLYKDGPRKDVDLVFYYAGNKEQSSNLDSLLDHLAKLGLALERNKNTEYDGRKLIMSGIYAGIKVDCFFPL